MRGLVADPWLWDATGNDDGYNALPLDRGPAGLDRALDLMGTELRRNRDPDALVRGHIAIQGMGSASDELEQRRQGRGRRRRNGAEPAPVLLPGGRRDRRPPLGSTPSRAPGGARRASEKLRLRSHEHPARRRARADRPKRDVDRLVPRRIDDVGRRRHLFTAGTAELYHRGVNVALGSDSSNWGMRFDLGLQGYLAVLTAREKLADRAARRGGRTRDGHDQRRKGGRARRSDRVTRAGQARRHRGARERRSRGVPADRPVSQLVYSARSSTVHTVLIDGRVVLEAPPPTASSPRRCSTTCRPRSSGSSTGWATATNECGGRARRPPLDLAAPVRLAAGRGTGCVEFSSPARRID